MGNETISLQENAVALLKELIPIKSFSGEENGTAKVLEDFLRQQGVAVRRDLNHVWAVNAKFRAERKTLLLNSHHDTVKPAPGYTNDPFEAKEEDGRLFGLGSNDAGGCLVSLMATFLYFYDRDLPFNLVFAASAEEETSGKNGMEALLPLLPPVDVAIVGEPTLMQMAVAERGLMVLDVTVKGRAGHAARDEGVNAIYKAVREISWFENSVPPKVSKWLGPVKMTVTTIDTPNRAHNVVPDECRYTVDIRLNELYTHAELLRWIEQYIESKATPRSTRLKAGFIAEEHPLVIAGRSLGLECYGSPTCSDMALMPFETLKIGPGDSARSHTADEFIFLSEIKEGITTYIALIQEYANRFAKMNEHEDLEKRHR